MCKYFNVNIIKLKLELNFIKIIIKWQECLEEEEFMVLEEDIKEEELD